MIQLNLFETPDIVIRLGERLFYKAPLYRSKTEYSIKYINKWLYNKIFGDAKNVSWGKMSDTLLTVFMATLDKNESHSEQIGWAYIDRQEDPMNLALSGNMGSGRAYYCGKIFNVKGEKTPLATSKNPFYSSGFLDLEIAVRETITANSLYKDSGISVSPILAILEMKNFCLIPHYNKEELMPCAKIIRIVDECTLERITHTFYLKTPLSKKQIIRSATDIGKAEAIKFTERVLHGAFSAGNISIRGDMLDLETVFCVKGRSPQYSITMKYLGNYFGFEYKGQLKILKALTENAAINTDRVSYDILKKKLRHSMRKKVYKELFYLMGFSNKGELFTLYKKEITLLGDMFLKLSKMAYYFPRGNYTNEPLAFFIHYYDFSKFFRYYAIMKRSGMFELELALSLLCKKERSFTHMETITDKEYSKEEVFVKFKDLFVCSNRNNDDLNKAGRQFIKLYDALYEKVISRGKIEEALVEMRAYIINQDRIYLNAIFSLCYWTIRSYEGLPSKEMSFFINTIIKANKRKPIKKINKYISDRCLYLEGYSFITLDGMGGFQFCLSLFRSKMPNEELALNAFKLNIEEQEYRIAVTANENLVTISSQTQSTKQLWEGSGHFLFHQINFILYYKENQIKLTNLLVTDSEQLLDRYSQ